METEVWIALAVAIPGAILAIIVMAAGGSRRARDLWRKSKESDDVEGVPYWMGRPPSLEEGLVGRKNDLKEIKGAFKKKKEVILAGGAGSGKSRLAVEHTYRSKVRGFWTPAGADVQQTLIALAPSFDIPTQGLSEADIAAAVRRRLADLPDKTLWAVDNLPSLDQFTALHEAAGPIRLLVTTRDSRKPLLSGTATLKKVGVLEPAAAVALLCSRDGCKRDEPVAAEIAQEVGYLPLALEILAIRLAREGQTARALLEELRSAPDQASVDAFQSAAGTTIDGAEGVLATLSGALDSLDGETRGRLAPFGYVADAPIPKPLAMALADADDGRFADFLEECASQSLVAASEGFMEIHGLTIAAIRATNVGGAAPRAALARGLPRLAAINESDPPALRAEMAHYDALLEQARAASPPDEGAIPTFANNLAIAYATLGRFIEAIPLFEQTLLDVERLRGPEHPDTLALGSRNNLANAYREAGRVAEAIPLNEQTLETLERILGREHPDTLGSRNNLAAAHAEAGRTDDAIPLFEQTLAARERLLGPEHPETLKSRNNLANAYQEAGRAGEAVPLHEQTLKAMERILDPEHPDTLRSRNNLANAYRAAGRHAEAIALHERTLRDSERLLGPEHPDALTRRHNLAIAYRAAGRVEEAIRLHEQTLEAMERILDPEHPDTLRSRNNLANAYRAAGRHAEAIALHERTLRDSERLLGPEHPDALTRRHNLAIAYRAAGRDEEAERLESGAGI